MRSGRVQHRRTSYFSDYLLYGVEQKGNVQQQHVATLRRNSSLVYTRPVTRGATRVETKFVCRASEQTDPRPQTVVFIPRFVISSE